MVRPSHKKRGGIKKKFQIILSSTSSDEDEIDFNENDEEDEKSADDGEEEDSEDKKPKKKQIKQLFLNATQVDSDGDESTEENPGNVPTIQSIIGVKDENTDSDADNENAQYYVKWHGKSYIHCSWVPKEELLTINGGDTALKKFNSKSKTSSLSASLSIPSLLTLEQDEINACWFEVDRIIGREGDMYYVKWKGTPYEQCTWEIREDIPNEAAIKKYEERRNHSNSIYIGENKRNVNPKDFVPIENPMVDPAGNTLRDYQVSGFNWLRYCWYNSNNSILADEMGLGKTLQIVAALNDIVVNHNITGPFLVVAPLSTLQHWKYEIERWTTMNCVIFHGSPTDKNIIQKYELPVYDDEGNVVKDQVAFDILITNYESLMSDYELFKSIEWRYLVLDEGHRMKNHTGKCYKMLFDITFEHCTLLTGTPIQNNVEELWALLHFLHPQMFDDLAAFMDRFGVINDADTITNLQKIIKVFLLRRKKTDVDQTIAAKEETIIEVELTRIQKTFYRALLHENAATLLQQITGGALPSLMNLMMQLRKVCNHPFLLKGATKHIEDETRKKLGEEVSEEEVSLRSIVDSSGKLILIDKLLPKLRADGHKVLIFSQMVKVLDILEDYLALLGIKCERIDGSVPENERQIAIERFASDKDAFIFLLCTRAGGVGINLTAADTVIIYDSDWNPQNDLQAESRCHRIGQTSMVKVYRLVTRGTYELEMLDRASKKLGLDHALLDGGGINSQSPPMAAKEIEKLLRRGVYNIVNDDDEEIDRFCAEDIDNILSRSKNIKQEIIPGNDSVFSKTIFNNNEEDLDMNSKDFWAKVLPSMKVNTKAEELPERRCKQQVKFQEESDDEEVKRTRKRGSTQITSVRALHQRMMHLGFQDTPIEKAFLYNALITEKELDEEDVIIIKNLIGVRDLSVKPEEFEQAEKKFTTSLDEFTDRKDNLIKRIVFFYYLKRVLAIIQGEVDTWPTSGATDDPFYDYCILYGTYLNGIGQQSKVFAGLHCEINKQFTDKMIHKYGINLVDYFRPHAETIDVSEIPKKFMHPDEWKDEHFNLFNREVITDDEIITMLHTIIMYGFRKNEAGEIDWGKIRDLSNLNCVKEEVVIEAGEKLYKLAHDMLDEEETKDIMTRLAEYGNKVWVSKMKSHERDFNKIKNFVEKYDEIQKDVLSKIRSWDLAPDWWNTEYDIALIKCLNDYGLVYVSVFLVDPERPFKDHIPANSFNEFVKASEVELSKGRPLKPKDAGEFSFLYSDKNRMNRVMLLINFIENRIEKQKRLEGGEDVEFENFADLTELPTLPLELGSQLSIFELGEFSNPSDSYPFGFKSHRLYFSVGDPNEKTWYEASTRRTANNDIQFVVKHLSQPEMEFTCHTSSGVWEKVIQEVQTKRGKLGMSKRKHTTVSGPFMFGFSNSTVTACFKLMKNQLRQKFPDSDFDVKKKRKKPVRRSNRNYAEPDSDDQNEDSDEKKENTKENKPEVKEEQTIQETQNQEQTTHETLSKEPTTQETLNVEQAAQTIYNEEQTVHETAEQ